jgi:chromosome segregation ATPase
MEAAQVPWRPIGELFVERGLIREEELEQALAEQVATGLQLGEILVRRNLISSPELTQTLMEQLGREVAKEDGFGSGLWAEIQRRNARSETASGLSLVEDGRAPFGPALGEALGRTPEEQFGLDSATAELEQDFTELRSELVVGGLPFSSLPEEASGGAIQAELEAVRRELQARDATVESLTSELEQVRRKLAAREETIAEESDAWQSARGEAEVLRGRLSERGARLAELEAEVASLTLSREQEDARTTGGKQEHDLAAAHRELDVRAARLAELETTLVGRDGRIKELERRVADTAAERDKKNERLAQAESRAAEAEQRLLDVQPTPAIELEQQLAVAEGGVIELEGQVSALRAQIAAADASLRDERGAHSQAQQRSEEAIAEAASGREDLRKFKRQLGVALGERDSAHSELGCVQASVAELQERASVHGEQLAAADAALVEERDAHAQTRQRSEEAIADAAIARQAIREVECELEVARSERDNSSAELEHARAAATELEQAGVELAEARGAANELEQRLSATAGRATELDRQVSALADQLTAAQVELDHAHGAKADLEQRLSAAGSRTMELDGQVSKLAAELAAAESGLVEERNAHASARERFEETRQRLDEATATLQEINDQETELAAAVDRLVEETTELSESASREGEAADLRLASLESRLAEEAASHAETRRVLSQALDELTCSPPVPGFGGQEKPGPEDYLCFAPGKQGYRLLPHSGRPPAVGDPYELDGAEHVVTRVGRSPLPFDPRRCVYLQAVS